MPTERIHEQQLAVASVYARSLLGLAREADSTAEVGEELAGLVELLDREPALERFLADPLVGDEARRRALETMLRERASDLVVDSLQVMNRKGRLGLVRALAVVYRRQLDELEGQIDVEVASAVPLSEEARRRLVAVASRFTGRHARLVETVDGELLGGLVVRVGDRKVDTSVAREVERLSRLLVERASKEIHGGRRFYLEAERGNA